MRYTLSQMQYRFQNNPEAGGIFVTTDVAREWLLDNKSIIINGKEFKIYFEEGVEGVCYAKLNYP